MESKISLTNEKDLIYGYKWEGSYLPKYGFCKVYKNGVVDFGKGCLLNDNEYIKGRLSISEEVIAEIQKLIHENSEIFSFRKLDRNDEILVTDSETDTFYFSDGEKINTFSIYAFLAWEEDDFRKDLPNHPRMALLVKLHESIRAILINRGLDEDCC